MNDSEMEAILGVLKGDDAVPHAPETAEGAAQGARASDSAD
jgi:hypothetical protein